MPFTLESQRPVRPGIMFRQGLQIGYALQVREVCQSYDDLRGIMTVLSTSKEMLIDEVNTLNYDCLSRYLLIIGVLEAVWNLT